MIAFEFKIQSLSKVALAVAVVVVAAAVVAVVVWAVVLSYKLLVDRGGIGLVGVGLACLHVCTCVRVCVCECVCLQG